MILYLATLLNLFNSYHFLVNFGIFCNEIILPPSRDIVIYPFLYECLLFHFVVPLSWLEVPVQCWTEVRRADILVVLDLTGKAFTIKCDVSFVFFIDALYEVNIPRLLSIFLTIKGCWSFQMPILCSSPSLWKVFFIIKRVLIFVKWLFFIYEMIM